MRPVRVDDLDVHTGERRRPLRPDGALDDAGRAAVFPPRRAVTQLRRSAGPRSFPTVRPTVRCAFRQSDCRTAAPDSRSSSSRRVPPIHLRFGRILAQVASMTPVVAYDRAGLGRSEWDDTTPTPRHVADRLRRVLRQIGADPPYVLVGFSWGGMLARYSRAITLVTRRTCLRRSSSDGDRVARRQSDPV